jgi:hypothetical protein
LRARSGLAHSAVPALIPECTQRLRINRPRYQKSGLNAGYASRPSYFWMPQVGYGTRYYAIIFCCPALFILLTVLISNAECPKGKRPQLARADNEPEKSPLSTAGLNRDA